MGGDGRAMTVNESLGALFAAGVPRRPSEIKNAKAGATPNVGKRPTPKFGAASAAKSLMSSTNVNSENAVSPPQDQQRESSEEDIGARLYIIHSYIG